jgi:glycosyltransferase involved in cell wall biosynthesis
LPALLSINNYYYLRGGAEAVFLRHNSLFEGMDWRVAPFAMHHPDNIDTQWSKFFVDEIEYGSKYSLWEKARRVPKVIYSFEARSKVGKLLDVFPADICHAHNIYHHISPSILGAVHGRGIPVVMTLHDLKLACPAYHMLSSDGVCERCKGGRTYNVLQHRCIKGSLSLSAIVLAENIVHRALCTFEQYINRFVVPSRFYLEKMVEWGWDRERFVLIPNAIDAESYKPDYRPGRSFIYFGRLSREKGLTTLIRAAALAGASLIIVGTGPDEQLLREYASTNGADVIFTGYLKGSALQDAIRSARAVVLPSEWYENSPLSVMEAYALGKPVIGAAIGGIQELIREDETGATFESGSSEDLAIILSRFIRLPDSDVSALGRAGRSLMMQEFSLELYRTRMCSLYQELGVP